MATFDPNEHRLQCEQYLSRFLKSHVRFVNAEPLAKSTRDAPWRLDVEVNSAARSFVLRLDSRSSEHEYEVLRAMDPIPIPTQRVYGWDPNGEALGTPCFFSDFIEGESLRKHMLAGEPWAEQLFIDTVCRLQAVTKEQLATVAHRFGEGETAEDFLEAAYEYFRTHAHPLADAVYEKLKKTMPVLPSVRFSNGDLWLDNLIVRNQQIVGVIDFENAGFSDPIYEFLLPFFVSPGLLDRGIEERYFERMGFDPNTLPWYHALEYFDTWHWVLLKGEPFVHHTADSLRAALKQWLDEG
ncbi:MAG TPA: phosphotransferase [Anaerolineae bacterium]|nr:phosphotransferase [Anaerolineae bacterium]